MKVGDKVRIERTDRRSWRTTYWGVIDWVDMSANPIDMVLVRLSRTRIEHTQYPDRGRDLPPPRSVEGFYKTEIIIEEEA